MAIANPAHWKEPFYNKGTKYNKIVEIIAAINNITDYTTDLTAYFKVNGRSNEDLTLNGTGKINSADGDYLSTLGRAAIGGIATDVALFSHRDFSVANKAAIQQSAAGLTTISFETSQKAEFRENGSLIADISGSGQSFAAGTRINEFSTDGTFAGDSDLAVPTEKATKTYVDTLVKGQYRIVLGTWADRAVNMTYPGTGTVGYGGGDSRYEITQTSTGNLYWGLERYIPNVIAGNSVQLDTLICCVWVSSGSPGGTFECYRRDVDYITNINRSEVLVATTSTPTLIYGTLFYEYQLTSIAHTMNTTDNYVMRYTGSTVGERIWGLIIEFTVL